MPDQLLVLSGNTLIDRYLIGEPAASCYPEMDGTRLIGHTALIWKVKNGIGNPMPFSYTNFSK